MEVYHPYKAISLQPIFGKIFEKIITRINYFIRNSQELNYSQHGFIHSAHVKSTESSFQEICSLIDLNVGKGNYIKLLSRDLKNAFDTLPWDTTIEKLNSNPLKLIQVLSRC